jgi:nucleoside transporter
MPTLGLTNTLAFHNITSQEKQFPIIRVFGTIGWIVANWVVSAWLHADKEPTQFYVTGGAAILLGLYSFTLPHTPPPAAGKKTHVREVMGLDALRRLSSFPFWVFIVSSFLICIPLAAYYSYAPVYADAVGFKDVAFNMSFGQVAEIFFMLVMPLFFAFLGVKWMLLVGMAAWVARYGLFAGAADDGILWMVLAGIILHGICYDFFFVTGFIYTDKKCTPEIRGQAQGLLVLVTQGLGLGIGAQVIGKIRNGFMAENHDQLVAQAGTLRSEVRALDQLRTALETLRDQAANLPETLRGQAELLWQQAEPFFGATAAKWQQSTDLMLEASNWRMIWLIPCIMAGVIMILFFLLFHDRTVRAKAAADAASRD